MTASIFLATALIIAQPSQDKSYIDSIPDHNLTQFKMIKLPDGEFKLGGKTHKIENLWIGETEITWDVFDIWAFRMDLTDEENARAVDAESRPSRPYGAPDEGYGHQGYAALRPTHQSAELFCKWLSEKTGKKYRLPTEAEWEYAARAGTNGALNSVGDYAWYWDNANDVAHPVKSKKANAWGIYDMVGNVAEWCNPVLGKEPVVRGGHFMNKVKDIGIAASEPYQKEWQLRDAQIPKSVWWLSDGQMIGLRVVCEGESSKKKLSPDDWCDRLIRIGQ